MELWTMSDQELRRFEVLQHVIKRQMTREQQNSGKPLISGTI